MAFQVGTQDGETDDAELVVDINTTPLIDVMLVLPIMLIITVPLQTHSVTMTVADGAPIVDPLPAIKVTVGSDGLVTWGGEPVIGRPDLERRLSEVAAQTPQPELHLQSDGDAPYRYMVGVLATAQRLGVTNVGVVEDK